MDLHVDRLTLRLAGVTTADARRLANLVAACLATADAPGGALTTERLRVSLAARPGESLDAMARRIASALLHTLARTS